MFVDQGRFVIKESNNLWFRPGRKKRPFQNSWDTSPNPWTPDLNVVAELKAQRQCTEMVVFSTTAACPSSHVLNIEARGAGGCSSIRSLWISGRFFSRDGKGSYLLIAGDVKLNNLHEMQKPLYNIEIGE